MSKKIAILTQPLHVNFGGTLQAFALQKVLMSMGFEVETINYVWKESSDLKKILAFSKNLVLGRKPTYFFFNKEIDYISKNHKQFINDHIFLSKKIKNSNELSYYFEEKNFDAVIVGSDQVWRVAYSPRIESFFLDFLKNKKNIKKIAYSASFGIDNWQFDAEKTSNIKDLINRFDAISVREKSAINLCKEYLNIEPNHTLDPTLLLNAKDYLNLVKPIKSENNKVFVYVLDKSEDKENVVNYICRKMNKDFFHNQPKENIKEKFLIKDLQPYVYPSIEGWLKGFVDADFIITDSFHGTVFSIIFNKPFISIINKERGASRFESLLEQLNLTDRIINHSSKLSENLIFKEIDYDNVNLKISELRNESIEYLNKALFG